MSVPTSYLPVPNMVRVSTKSYVSVSTSYLSITNRSCQYHQRTLQYQIVRVSTHILPVSAKSYVSIPTSYLSIPNRTYQYQTSYLSIPNRTCQYQHPTCRYQIVRVSTHRTCQYPIVRVSINIVPVDTKSLVSVHTSYLSIPDRTCQYQTSHLSIPNRTLRSHFGFSPGAYGTGRLSQLMLHSQSTC